MLKKIILKGVKNNPYFGKTPKNIFYFLHLNNFNGYVKICVENRCYGSSTVEKLLNYKKGFSKFLGLNFKW